MLIDSVYTPSRKDLYISQVIYGAIEISPISKESMENHEQTQAPDLVAPAENHEKTPKESFAELRKAKEDLERQLWQAQKEKEMFEKQMQMQAQYQQKPQAPPEEEFDFKQLANEEFVPGTTVYKAFDQVNKKLSAYEQQLAQKDQKLLFLETAQSLPDFNQVVTADNIKKYIETDEDNLEAVNKAGNPLRKAYNLIKKSAAYQNDIAAKAPISQEQKRVNDKEAAPRHTSIGVRSEAVGTAARMSNSTMSKSQREALWRETQSLARR